jgi:hypothetical protein
MMEAKEEVRTTRRMGGWVRVGVVVLVLAFALAAALRRARTPLMAGRISSVSLFVVL